MTGEGDSGDVAGYTAQYELLRSQVVGPTSGGEDRPRGLGLALLLSEGMPGWLKNVALALAPRDSPASHSDPPQADRVVERLSAIHQQEIATLLASLVLSTLTGAANVR